MAVTTLRPPYAAYAGIMGAFIGGLGVAGAAARVLGRNPACQTPLDLVVLSAASFKASRTLAHDEVTSFVREPFVHGEAHGRLLTWSLAAAGANDFLQASFAALARKSNELEPRVT